MDTENQKQKNGNTFYFTKNKIQRLDLQVESSRSAHFKKLY